MEFIITITIRKDYKNSFIGGQTDHRYEMVYLSKFISNSIFLSSYILKYFTINKFIINETTGQSLKTIIFFNKIHLPVSCPLNNKVCKLSNSGRQRYLEIYLFKNRKVALRQQVIVLQIASALPTHVVP